MEKLIALTDIYYIGADKYNWILYKKYKKKNGEIDYKGEKFYPTLESLLTNFTEMKCRGLIHRTNDLKILVDKMSTEREKWLKEAHRKFGEVKKEGFYE